MKRKLALAAAVTTLGIATVAVAVPRVAPAKVEAGLNRVLTPGPWKASDAAQQLHDEALVVDLHADSLLWGRDLGVRAEQGQVDFPRLREGGVALQALTLVTRAPKGQNIHATDPGGVDNAQLLMVATGRAPATWTSPKARALAQAAEAHAYAESDGKVRIIRTKRDLKGMVIAHQRDKDVLGVWIGIEGAHALDGELAAVDELFEAGIRMMAPTHFFDNAVGGSAHGLEKGGLTELGRSVIARQEELGIAVDLAHASAQTQKDILAMATKPVVVSHTGVRGTCDTDRNLSDAQVRAIAASGGVIGIGFWETATCGTDAAAIARAMRYVRDLVGIEHVALGSDFDGAVATPFDASGMPLVTEALIAQGFTPDQLTLALGGNTLRVLDQTLPEH
ncbi:MAG: membrane dipeptidase [Proteobacteria bacterium]|nr:membrane dipeptidase [Pseudomonadota bacterium]